jgi:hypothetical protein
VFTQIVPHATWDAGHAQTPPTHVALGGQALLHAPQCAMFVFLSTHSEPQVFAAGHVHAPLWQTVNPGHVAPLSIVPSQSLSFPLQTSVNPG